MTPEPPPKLTTRLRTHTCGELRVGDVGAQVELAGWLHNRRDLGGVQFIDLRDHYGITQIVVRPESGLDLGHTPKESVLRIHGEVLRRSDETVNPRLDTGEIEVDARGFEILGESRTLPFSVFPEDDAPEEMRLRHRFLDLRRERMHANVLLRSRVIEEIRRRMRAHAFVEIQTPTLTASSPEGARDYLVPSRVHPGKFYALPQAPQQFKQLLMVSGFDRYFQIAACYRDEDARADRSPGEFYQLDLEMAYVTQEDVFEVVEDVLHGLFSEIRPDRELTPQPFPRIPYDVAMERYGSDKPDLRNPLTMVDVTQTAQGSGVRAFAGAYVSGMSVPTREPLPRRRMDEYEARLKERGAAGLAWLVVEPGNELRGPLARHISDEARAELLDSLEAGEGDTIFLVADPDTAKAQTLMGLLRVWLGEELELLEDAYRFCWVVDFPMYERDEETGEIGFSHNPFSMPQGGLEALDTLDPLDVKAWQYDVVCNGYELSSGAIRNHRLDVMYRAFEIAGYSAAQVDERFGALGRAFRYGAPPHGGIAPGIDRIVMLLGDEPNIREVIPFPMNQRAQDLLMGAPAEVLPQQLRELHLKVTPPAPTRADSS
ncbi:MAG TPA: aspartate--tRNA ligase [Thermoleophilaceae bacterium]